MRRSHPWLLLISASVLFALPSIGAAESPAEALTPDRLIPFKETASGPLQLHVFFPPGGRNSPALRPAVIFFFGGGWRTGSAKQFYPQAALLAKKGIIAISADYRTKESHGSMPGDSVEDAVAAMHWLREHGTSLGVDPNRLVASGGSAGGHLAACLAFVEPARSNQSSRRARPDALVLFNPVLDLSTRQDVAGPGWMRISPRDHLSGDWPPTVIFNGVADVKTSIEIARQVTATLKSHGVDITLQEYPDQGHGFFNFRPKSPENFERTMEDTVRFLSTHGFLPTAAATVGK